MIFNMDCREALTLFPDATFDSIVTDPPYALDSISKRFGNSPRTEATMSHAGPYARASRGFMGMKWDTGDVAFDPAFWAQCLRVLKPGGHMMAFGGTRTYHRLACAIEDGGFEIRDQFAWVYGSGFPKSHDVSKAIDREAGAAREVIKTPMGTTGNKYAKGLGDDRPWMQKAAELGYHEHASNIPATDAAREWSGWGTAVKPAWEPICFARKPLDGTVAANVLAHGTGAINIDGCRVPSEKPTGCASAPAGGVTWNDLNCGLSKSGDARPVDGRFPANLQHDGSDEVLAAFPNAPGQQGALNGGEDSSANIYGKYGPKRPSNPRNDSGSAARFFYCAKASKRDREEGLEGFETRASGMVSNNSGQHITRREEGYEPPQRRNTHPTVKPTDLMRYYCRLITPPGGIVLDPFAGSGSTGKAAILEGFGFIGFELDADYANIAQARIDYAVKSKVKT